MLDGVARKNGLVLAILTFLPWLLTVIGLGLSGSFQVGSQFFPHWYVSVAGVPTIVLGCVHAFVSTPTPAKKFRFVTTLTSIVFLLNLGMLQFTFSPVNPGVSVYTNLIFAGSLLVTLAWAGQMVMWGFYEEDSREQVQ